MGKSRMLCSVCNRSMWCYRGMCMTCLRQARARGEDPPKLPQGNKKGSTTGLATEERIAELAARAAAKLPLFP